MTSINNIYNKPWQEFLWTFYNQNAWWWDWVSGTLSLMTAVMLFWFIVMRSPFNLLKVSRIIMCAGYASSFFINLNSGAEKIALMLFSIGGFFTVILIVTDYCKKTAQSPQVSKKEK